MARIEAGEKLIAYVLDAATLAVKDLLEIEGYTFVTDTEFAQKSTVTVAKEPQIAVDDFVVCQSGGNTAFVGICQTWASGSDTNEYTITLLQKENLFDRFVFVGAETIISSTGIEDYIVSVINANWINSGDAMTDKPYMTATALTHTPIYAQVGTTVDLTDGAFNLKTYLGNALEYYDIYVDFDFSTTGSLAITVYHDTTSDIDVDTELSDIAGYTETYAVNALTKLLVEWHSGTEESPVITNRTFYLLTNRTITENAADPNRAEGSTKSMVIESETENEMLQTVRNQFAGNSYTHKIVFDLFMDSKLYDYTDFYIGHNSNIKTKSGVKNSLVTAVSVNSNSRFARITFGKLKTTLIEKIRAAQ